MGAARTDQVRAGTIEAMTTTTASTAIDEAFERYLDEHAAERLESYKELVRIPSISALPQHAPDCRRTAEWIAADLRHIGMEHVDVSETGGHPIVYADWLHAPGAPTVLVYCHYDVQPVDPLDLWTSPPFEPVVEGHRILGRASPTTRASSTSISAPPRRCSRRVAACRST